MIYGQCTMDPSWTQFNETTWFHWTSAILGSCLVGLSGVIPLILLPQKPRGSVKSEDDNSSKRNLNRQLSFAVGGLLGDVFLHLLPESYAYNHSNTGLWIILGILCFLIIEKVFEQSSNEQVKSKRITGYLNLLANCIDNFIHGLAVASSFLGSTKLGLTTVLAILVHEIPHEIGDFAILLNSGFSRFEAAKAQLATAGIGLLGACFALWVDAVDATQAASLWILPFSAGGFLNIALVSVLPDILKEEDPKECFIQLICLLLGVTVMSVLCLL